MCRSMKHCYELYNQVLMQHRVHRATPQKPAEHREAVNPDQSATTRIISDRSLVGCA